MPLRRSFIIRLFAAIFALLLTLLILGGVGIYSYTSGVVGEELVRLNQVSLRQIASATGRTFSEIRAFGERIAIDGRLLELAGGPADGETGREARNIFRQMVTERNVTGTNSLSMLEAAVVGRGGLWASSYNSKASSLEQLWEDPALETLFRGGADMVFLPTSYNDQGRWGMTYTFQAVFPMADLFSGELMGLLVLELSELTLYSQYKAYIRPGVDLMMVDGAGQILSARDKSSIGTFSGFTGAVLARLDETGDLDGHIVDGAFFIYEPIPGTGWHLVERMSADSVMGPLNQVRSVLLVTIAVYGSLVLAALTLIARRMFRRVLRIKDKMEQVIGGDLDVRIQVEREDEFGRIENAFNTMVAEIDRLIGVVRQRERQKRLAELDFLQAQINPHFIHNTLTSIRFMLEMDKTREAGEMIFCFSKLLRQTLSRSDEFIPLGDELDTLESYVNLQKLRYRESFEASYDVQPGTRSAWVPALILQPVVENAIFHGVGHHLIHIRISARRAGDDLILTVEDDGVGMPKELQASVLHKDVQVNRVGLRNVHDRIQLNYGKEYGLRIDSREGGGTAVTFTLPFDAGGEEGQA